MSHFFSLLELHPTLYLGLIGLLGILVGSFLNVVIHRLPRMMHQDWQQQCASLLERPQPSLPPLSLSTPRSHCPQCKTPIRIRDNIPLLSYLLLKGQCRHCHTAIALRYPLIELMTACLSMIIAYQFGVTLLTLAGLCLIWFLIPLTMIDYDEQLLPDSLTLPLLWLGLFFNLFQTMTTLQASIIGAIAGYLSLWSIFQLFKFITGKEGMGYGDFKLLAALGAWLGWHYLPMIIMLSALLGTVIGAALILFRGHSSQVPIPFGPYLSLAGLVAFLAGNAILTHYFLLIGLH